MRRMLLALCVLVSVVGVSTTTAPAGAAEGFTARGSVEQVYTYGHPAGSTVDLLDDDGAVVQTGTADAAGAKLFRKVPPGTDYQVRQGADTVDDLTVTSPTDHPTDAWYAANAADHPLAAGFGYLTTRDGTDLSVNVTMPADDSPGPWPVVINYSGYDPSQPGGAPQEAAMYPYQGYVVVGVNLRGTGCSGGAFEFMETLQGLDGYDLVETIAHQSWSNGHVGLVGISYSGYSQLYVGATNPPHLDAIAPLSPYSDTYSGILYPGGILNNGFAYNWASEREEAARPRAHQWVRNRIDGGDTRCADNQVMRLQALPLLERIRNTPYADHEFDYLNTETFVHKIKMPTFLSSQWQDEQTGGSAANLVPFFSPTTKVFASFTNGTHVEPMAPTEIFESMVFIELYVGKRVPHISGLLYIGLPTELSKLFRTPENESRFKLPINAWTNFTDYPTALAYYEAKPRVRLRWENGSVPGSEGLPIAATVTRHANWPVDGTTNEKLYLQPDGVAAAAEPTVADAAARGASSYTYDPATKRTRTYDGSTDDAWAPHPNVHWNPLKEGSSLSFLTPAYSTQVAYAGQGSADLWLRSSAADTDLEVTLTEVRPDGKEVYIQSGWLRASHRYEDPDRTTELVPYQDHQPQDAAPLPAGEFTKVRVEIFPFAHVIRAGSRLRINVEAPGGNQDFWEFQSLTGTATNEIGHSVGHPSRVVLPKLPAAQSPTLPAAFPACTLSGVTTQSVSLRNQPCRDHLPARTPTAVAASVTDDDVAVTWSPPAGATPTAYRVTAELGAGAPAGATAPAAVEVPGSATTTVFADQPEGVPLEFRVQATFDSTAAPMSDASLPVVVGPKALRLFGTWEAFVRRQLTDFTGSARSDWVRNDVKALQAGKAPEDYLAGVRRGSDARNNTDPVTRLYLASLGRLPSAAGMRYWLPKRRAGQSLASIAQAFVTGPEFIARYGRPSNRAYVQRVFVNTTGTTGPEATVDYLTAALDGRHLTRGQVMVFYSEATAYKTSKAVTVDAANVYLAMVGRAPTTAETWTVAVRLGSGTTLARVMDDVMRSPAYAARIDRLG
ncbi:MAG: putative hydrolase, CocE/NonD family [Acidimicrobiales bacterium]|nr:putative hydrolase, CocE/NonD family [Acidimicrobiales bacterium]